MIRRLVLAGLLLGSLPATAATPTRGYTVIGFDKIRVDGPFDVTVRTGLAPSARATGSTAALDRISISAQGSTPADLRRHVLVRAGTVGVVGLAAGLAAGAVVAALVVAVVTVSAGAENALPPLLLSFDWPLAAVALGALIVTAAAAASATVRRLR